jgi:transposase
VPWATTTRSAAGERRIAGRPDNASALKGSRWALLKNPENLTGAQQTTIASNDPLYRAYLIKEQLREVFSLKGTHGQHLLTGDIVWTGRSQLPEMTALAKTLRRFKPLINNTLQQELANAGSETTNTHIRVLTRQPYGFHSAKALVAMIELTEADSSPPLPGRITA